MEMAQVMFIHWLADFVFQSHWMASNKSKNFLALLSHVLIYATIIYMGCLNIRSEPWVWLAVFAPHLATDFCTSRLNTYLWEKKDIHNFFVSIGFDQFLHYICLYLIYGV